MEPKFKQGDKVTLKVAIGKKLIEFGERLKN